jgi:hypothetical protein
MRARVRAWFGTEILDGGLSAGPAAGEGVCLVFGWDGGLVMEGLATAPLRFRARIRYLADAQAS